MSLSFFHQEKCVWKTAKNLPWTDSDYACVSVMFYEPSMYRHDHVVARNRAGMMIFCKKNSISKSSLDI